MKKNYIIPSTEHTSLQVTTLCASVAQPQRTVIVKSGSFNTESQVN
ncbi:MAG: hypothetical protein IJ609_02445 [Paludibacteraceae bacterium]|nr:hypothetical protein [Paludibacteraceae bacterium]